MIKEQQIERLNERFKARIGPSPIHGVGVFAMRDVAKGQSLYSDATPEVYTLRYSDLNKLFPEIKQLLLERFPSIVMGSRFVYPTDRLQAYMNHSENPNYDAINDVALQDIKQGEEVTENYRLILGYQQVFKWLLDKQ